MPPVAEEMGLPVPYAQAERMVKARFWWKVRAALGRVPFMEDAIAAYYCAVDTATPLRVRITLMAALAYFVMPVDAIPDILSGLGFTDDASVLAATLAVVGSHITQVHRAAARRILMKPEARD
ncbi:MAG TPA: DUF1232 domain-containing protein [Alphaproteobacteria bacterium]|nr:DUF1232 domain-containing protein [Alphaproteobacteria bacterium]HAJ47730.1 DUF1232 domain-containing protein [Alphaproteobacteria bacterium]